MRSNDRSRCRRAMAAASTAGVMAAALLLGGCADPAHSGALIGAGVGAVAGQASGRDTESTIGGAAVGAGIGYAVGREYDRSRRSMGHRSNGHGHGHGHGHDGHD